MIINNDIRKAIKEYLDTNGMFNNDLASKLNISPNTVLYWTNGKSSSIRQAQWEKLHPLIKQYLPKALQSLDEKQCVEYSKLQKIFDLLDEKSKEETMTIAVNQLAKLRGVDVELLKDLLDLK